jgi:FkbM family methyltransferase
MCGHAIVSTVHDRLNVVDQKQQELLARQDRTENTLQQLKEDLGSLTARLDSVQQGDGTAAIERAVSLRQALHDTADFLANQSVRQVCVETSDYLSTNPELGLFSFLYSYLPSRVVLDIGAHVGDVSEHLLKTGYEVYAFEPYSKSYDHLVERLSSHPEFHAFNLAIGNVTGDAPLHLAEDHSSENRYEDATVFHSLRPHGMPADLCFTDTLSVPVQKLSELHKRGLVPSDISLVKIDTEGYDLEVIRGMDDYRYPVVTVEFWDSQIPFASQGLLYTVESMACEMRQRGYLWYIVIYRVWGRNETAFFCNHNRPVPNSWGNIVFFLDRETFLEAQHWCFAALPRTYFKHVPANAAIATP